MKVGDKLGVLNLLALAVSTVLLPLAAQASAPPSGVDLTGLWTVPDNSPNAPKSSGFPQNPAFTAEGRAKSKFWADNPQAYPGGRCLPGRGPFTFIMVGDLYPLEIIQKPKQVTVISEYQSIVKRVYLDQKAHDPDVDNSWIGDSIGHWSGGTLYIDTIAPNEGIINGAGSGPTPLATDNDIRLPFSQSAHIEEKIRLLKGNRYLKDEVTVTDPKYYTTPIHLVSFWKRAPSSWKVKEYFCSENPRHEDQGPAAAQGKAKP